MSRDISSLGSRCNLCFPCWHDSVPTTGFGPMQPTKYSSPIPVSNIKLKQMCKKKQIPATKPEPILPPAASFRDNRCPFHISSEHLKSRSIFPVTHAGSAAERPVPEGDPRSAWNCPRVPGGATPHPPTCAGSSPRQPCGKVGRAPSAGPQSSGCFGTRTPAWGSGASVPGSTVHRRACPTCWQNSSSSSRSGGTDPALS